MAGVSAIFRISTVVFVLVYSVLAMSDETPPASMTPFGFSHPILANLTVTHVSQDSYGRLWISAEEGLYRYDGFFVERIDDSFNDGKKLSMGLMLRTVQIDQRYLLLQTVPYRLFLFDLQQDKFVDEPYGFSRLSKQRIDSLLSYSESTFIGISPQALVMIDTANKQVREFPIATDTRIYSYYLSGDNVYLNTERNLYVLNLQQYELTELANLPQLTHGMPTGYPENKLNELIHSDWHYQARMLVRQGIVHFIDARGHWRQSEDGFVLVKKLPTCDKQFGNKASVRMQPVITNEYFIYADHCGIYRYSVASKKRETLVHNDNESDWLLRATEHSEFAKYAKYLFITRTGGYLYKGETQSITQIPLEAGLQNMVYFQVNEHLAGLQLNQKGGVLFSPNKSNFSGLSSAQLNYLLGTDKLRTALFISNNSLAVATQNRGLFILTRKHTNDQQWRVAHHFLDNSHVRGLLHENNDLWVGTEGSGIYHLNLDTFAMTTLDGNKQQYAFTFVRVDEKHLLMNHHYSLSLVNTDQSIEDIQIEPRFSSGEQFRAVLQDYEGNIWLGKHDSEYPLVKLSPELEELKRYSNADIGYFIFDIEEDSSQQLWFATWGGGVSIKAPMQDRFFQLTEQDGLPSDTVFSVTMGKDGNLWLATANGLSRISPCLFPCKPRITNYDQRDGLSTINFDAEASYKQADGTLVYGGIGGLVWFNPVLDIHDNPDVVEQIFFTQAQIDGKKYPEPLIATESLDLAHNIQQVSLRFTSPNYISPDKNQYRYRINQGDWLLTEKPEINLSFIQPGTYELEASASNNQFEWAKNSAKLTLNISAPWWANYYAYTAYALILFIVGLSTMLWRVRRVKARNKLLQTQVANRTQKLQQVLADKERIFQNISHEFRTPLTIIMGQAERLTERSDFSEAITIHEQSVRLFELVERLLKLAELRATKLEPKVISLLDEADRILAGLIPLADTKNVKLISNFDVHPNISITLLEDSLPLIMNNLVKNAVQYSPNDTQININLLLQDELLSLEVIDQGKGFESPNVASERFQREDDTTIGSGLGLAIVKEVVEGNKGSMLIENLDIGARVSITMPVVITSSKLHEAEQVDESIAFSVTPSTKGSVLVVEDEVAMQKFIEDVLTPYFDVKICSNGEEAMARLHTKALPDMILSEGMMPKMTGIELCRQVKSDPELAHIAVILLTAKADPQSLREGLMNMADDYMTKPFSSQALAIKLTNLLNTRQAHQRKLVNALTGDSNHPSSNKENSFADEVRAEFNKHYSNPDYALADLAKYMNLTERTLTRRFQSTFNLTFVSLLRNYRLHQAKQLLQKGKSVSEVAFDCGFNSDTYFGRCYKQKYGMTPKQTPIVTEKGR